MNINDLPTIKKLREQLNSMSILVNAHRFLSFFGFKSETLSKLEKDYDKIVAQLNENTHYLQKFVEYFAKDGWVPHDSFDTKVAKLCVDSYENQGAAQAVNHLLHYYGAEAIQQRLFMFNHANELEIRRKFIEFALEDYREGRYYSTIPLVLMMIDGAVNDATGAGFHTSDKNLDVWDSFTMVDGAIYTVRDLFKKGRKKTRLEEIDQPFRNGILHGMDLGYDNQVVAAKSWHMLFIVRDWLVAKQSEEKRKAKFEQDKEPPSWKDILKKIAKNSDLKKALNAWQPRDINSDYINKLDQMRNAHQNSPEAIGLEFLGLWQKQNYGHIAKLFWTKKDQTPKKIRQQFGDKKLQSYKILGINDEAPAICVIKAEIVLEQKDGQSKSIWEIRMLKEDEQGSSIPSNLSEGAWKIIWCVMV